MSRHYTETYPVDLQPLAERIGDMLIKSPGYPPEYTSPVLARNASFIGLSDSRPGIISSEKVYSLSFFNATEIGRLLKLDDSENAYGIRIEISADDGSVCVASGYMVDDGTMDVIKSTRLSIIRQPDSVEKAGKVIVFLWRECAGTKAADI